jgi:acetyltransferase-like isoleucine patch superfamily enzyme
MAYLTQDELLAIGFKKLGDNVRISDKASIYDAQNIEIGSNSRIDDFCVVSGKVVIGRNVHITPQCLVAGGVLGVEIGDFVALAYQTKVFSQSDDYSGLTMTNSTVPKCYKNEIIDRVAIGRHSIIGAGSTIMPGVVVADGCAIGAHSLVMSSTEPWSIYAGSPAKKINTRSKSLLVLENKYLRDIEK